MAQRHHHYEHAFEGYLRSRRVPYVAVDEARKALLPERAPLRLCDEEGRHVGGALKSFDFVVYGPEVNLLVDVKGRKVPRRAGGDLSVGRLESWVTREDVEGLATWRRLFGAGFDAAFVFLYWCEAQPPDGLFQEVFEHQGRWYALRAARLDPYRAHMRVRSQRWGTVHLSTQAFERVSEPFHMVWEGPRAAAHAG